MPLSRPVCNVRAAAVEGDGVPFPEKFAELRSKLERQFPEGERLDAVIAH